MENSRAYNFVTTYVARSLLALPFLAFGVIHLIHPEDMTTVVSSHLSWHVAWAYLMGVVQIVCAVLLIVGWRLSIVAWVLATLLFAMVLTVDVPHALQPEQSHAVLENIVEHLALCGGLFAAARR